MTRLFRLAVERPAFFGLCLVAACEAIMNAAFGWWSANHWALSLVFAGLYMGSEMAKWFAAEGIGAALREAEKARALAWGLLLVCTLMISIPAHIGFIGMLRDGAVQQRDTSATKRDNAKATIENARSELARIGTTRTPEEIGAERELECKRTSRTYKDGKGPACTKLTTEEAAAKRGRELQTIISEAEGKLDGNNVSVADARVVVLGWIWPEAKSADLQLMLSIVIALCVEAITAFGFIAVGHRQDTMLTLDTLVNAGAATHPVADSIVAFRAEMVEMRPGSLMTEDELWQAYDAWAAGKGRTPMARAVFMRIFEATGARRHGGHFVGLRFKQRAA